MTKTIVMLSKYEYSFPVEKTNSLAIVMEYLKGGNLKELIKQKGFLNEI